MSRTSEKHGGLLSVVLVVGLALAPAAIAQECDSCGTDHCPPYYKYHYEGAPKIKFKRACPRPICDPCTLPHYGYYQTCWHPWPFPPDWSHCPVPPPGALAPQDPLPPGARRLPGEPPLSEGEKSGMPRRSDTPSDTSTPPAPPSRALPVGDAEKQAPIENASEPVRTSTDKRPAEQWVPPPSLPPPSLPPLGNDVPTPPKGMDVPPSRLPNPPSPMPQSSDQRLPPTLEPPRAEPASPLSMRPDRPPSPATLPDKPVPAIAQTGATSLADAPGSSPYADAQRPKQVCTGPGGSNMRMVNSRRIMLDYDLADIPKPDQTLLELWYTQDGKHWEKDNTALKGGSPYMVEVNREGTYGFTLVARHVGEKCEPPAPGEQPQVWVEVDWKKPVVHMVQGRPLCEAGSRQLAIIWLATDNNMAAQPITLSWASGPDGPWHAFAKQIENSGRYNWQVPGNVPARVYLRVEAFDLVGNVGMATTPTPVIVPIGGH